jgi:hypothetical protein
MVLLMPGFHFHGALRVIVLVSLVIVVIAFVDLLFRPGPAFIAADKQAKGLWVMLLILGSFVPVIGVPGAIFYWIDVRPAVIAAAAAPPPKSTPPRSSSRR